MEGDPWDGINKFLLAERKEIVEKFGFYYDRRYWFLVKPSTIRSGSFFPLGGYRSLGLKSRFVAPGETKLDKKPFDELKNFRSSQIFEIASKPRDSLNGPNVLYWVYGFFSFVPILRPCKICLRRNERNCDCDTLLVAFIEEFQEVVRQKQKNIHEPFTYDLKRNFNLRVAEGYDKEILPGPERLTEYYLEGPLILSDNIATKDGKLIPAKPQSRGVIEALKSVFSHKNAPESSFSLPADSYDRNPNASLSVTLTDDSLNESSLATDSHTPRKSLCDEIHVASPHHPAGKPFTPDLSSPDQSTLTADDITVAQIHSDPNPTPTPDLTTQTSDSRSTEDPNLPVSDPVEPIDNPFKLTGLSADPLPGSTLT